MNITHTPTPWIASSDMIRYEKDDNQHNIATVWSKPEDAAFIVKAVNMHEELVRALKAFVDQATKLSGYEQCYLGVLVDAKTAIAKAEGK